MPETSQSIPIYPVAPAFKSSVLTEATCDSLAKSICSKSPENLPRPHSPGSLLPTDVFYGDNLTTDELALLRESSIKGQEYRLSHLSGRWLLLTCIGTDRSKTEVYQHLNNRGINMVVLENEGNEFAEHLLATNVIKGYLAMDLTSRPTLIPESVKCVADYFSKIDKPISGILTFWDDAVALHARLCEVFGLPGNSVHGIDVAHDKHASRRFFKDLGYASPKSCIVRNESELEAKTEDLTFPCILKPLYGAASIGVQKVNTRDALLQGFKNVTGILEQVYADGDLMGLLFDDAEDVGKSDADLFTICVEEFLDGPEFDCDVVVKDGIVSYVNLIDDWEAIQPHFCEIGSCSPSARSEEIKAKVIEFGRQVIMELGFTGGIFHVEIIYSERLGPVLVECNPRMGGGPVRAIHKNVYGVDLADEACLVACGIPSAPVVTKSDRTAITINLHAQKSGTLSKSVEDCVKACVEGNSEVVSYVGCGSIGETLTGWYDGYPSHLGRVNMMMTLEAAAAVNKGIKLREIIHDEIAKFTL